MSADKLCADAHIAFGALTASFATGLALTGEVAILMFSSSLNTSTRISFDGSTYMLLGPGEKITLDVATNKVGLSSSVQVRYDTAPASGQLDLFAIYR
jgi:hypothetical protein